MRKLILDFDFVRCALTRTNVQSAQLTNDLKPKENRSTFDPKSRRDFDPFLALALNDARGTPHLTLSNKVIKV